MLIRKAKMTDLKNILDIYTYARTFMADNGNASQWGDGYPKKELLVSDIEKEQLFVCEEDGRLYAVFAFVIGADPTYAHIEKGSWINEETYGTIHRIASCGEKKGLSRLCIDFCKGIVGNLRADTHEHNNVMQRVLEKNGFKKCGIIYVEDGSPRIAYQFTEQTDGTGPTQ